MFSVPDILVVSVLALLLFGPDRLPKIMRQAGRFMRDVQNTSQSFISEMERAADGIERPVPVPAKLEPLEPAAADLPEGYVVPEEYESPASYVEAQEAEAEEAAHAESPEPEHTESHEPAVAEAHDENGAVATAAPPGDAKV